MSLEGTTPTQTTWRLDATSPYAYVWNWDAEKDRLIVNVLHATPVVEPPTSQDIDNPFIKHLDTEVLATEPYPMVRLTFQLAPGTGFKVEKVDGDVKSLRLTLGPQESIPIAMVEGGDTFRQILRGLIVLDPGHGGSDPGCHSPMTGVREKDVTLDICLKMKAELEQRGLRVILTRTDDRDLTYAGSPDSEELGARAAVANENQADVFVSIHCNASVSSAPRGTAVHWYKNEDYSLAQLVRDGIEGASLSVPMNGLVRSRFYVLRHTVVPSILVETAYLTNPSDGDLLGQEGFRRQMAVAICDGLADYMGKVAHVNTRAVVRTASSAPRPPAAAASLVAPSPVSSGRPPVQPLVFPMDNPTATDTSPNNAAAPAPVDPSVTPSTPSNGSSPSGLQEP
jgi:N-acetylmuramoyl-L-alanine amidase